MIICGRNTVTEALRSDFQVKKVFLQKGIEYGPKMDRIVSLAKERDVEINYTDNRRIMNLAQSTECQGAAADINFKTFNLRTFIKASKEPRSLIYVSDYTFEQNLGAIIRTAECAGFGGVIVHPQTEITSTVARISTGAIFHIPIMKNSLFPSIKELRDNGYFIFGIERSGKNYFDVNLDSPSLFIIGGEDKSLSDSVRKKCDDILEIPQFGNVSSLNMSVATAIIIFDSVRQKLTE